MALCRLCAWTDAAYDAQRGANLDGTHIAGLHDGSALRLRVEPDLREWDDLPRGQSDDAELFTVELGQSGKFLELYRYRGGRDHGLLHRADAAGRCSLAAIEHCWAIRCATYAGCAVDAKRDSCGSRAAAITNADRSAGRA
jgi:hypothetical protein